MKCCKKELADPDIVDGTAYFVCPECGDVREIEDYRVYTTGEALADFKEKYGFILPKEYVALSESEQTKVIKLPPCETESLKYYFGEEFYEIGLLASVDPNAENSIYSTICSGKEWGLPSEYIPIAGDGHTWLVLDYSDSATEPRVVLTEADEGSILLVAKSFNDFVSALLQYEQVYDSDGNLKYVE